MTLAWQHTATPSLAHKSPVRLQQRICFATMDDALLDYQAAVKDSKFLHLLKPIRDLAENWNIDIASELEDYLTQLDSTVYSFDGGTGVDFAEAALLIQSSAVVYSKKVEYLQQLVNKAIEASRARARSNGGERDGEEGEEEAGGVGKGKRSRARAARELGDSLGEFMTAGDDLEEDDDIDLGAARHDCDGQAPTYTRAPAALLALEDQTSNGDAGVYRVAQCYVHASGALVLDYRDGSMYDGALHVTTACTSGAAAAPAHGGEPAGSKAATEAAAAPHVAAATGPPPADDDEDGAGHLDTGFDHDNDDDDGGGGGGAGSDGGDDGMRSEGLLPMPPAGPHEPPCTANDGPSLRGATGAAEHGGDAAWPRSPDGAHAASAQYFDPYERLDPNAAGDLPIKPMRVQKLGRARAACLARRPPGAAGPPHVPALVCQVGQTCASKCAYICDTHTHTQDYLV